MNDRETVRAVKRQLKLQCGTAERVELHAHVVMSDSNGQPEQVVAAVTADYWLKRRAAEALGAACDAAKLCKTTADLLASGNHLVWETTNASIGTPPTPAAAPAAMKRVIAVLERALSDANVAERAACAATHVDRDAVEALGDAYQSAVADLHGPLGARNCRTLADMLESDRPAVRAAAVLAIAPQRKR